MIDKDTIETETMTRIGFRINTEHVPKLRMLNSPPVKHLLSQIIKLVRVNPSHDPDRIKSLLPNYLIEKFSEPPNPFIKNNVPFL